MSKPANLSTCSARWESRPARTRGTSAPGDGPSCAMRSAVSLVDRISSMTASRPPVEGLRLSSRPVVISAGRSMAISPSMGCSLPERRSTKTCLRRWRSLNVGSLKDPLEDTLPDSSCSRAQASFRSVPRSILATRRPRAEPCNVRPVRRCGRTAPPAERPRRRWARARTGCSTRCAPWRETWRCSPTPICSGCLPPGGFGLPPWGRSPVRTLHLLRVGARTRTRDRGHLPLERHLPPGGALAEGPLSGRSDRLVRTRRPPPTRAGHPQEERR